MKVKIAIPHFSSFIPKNYLKNYLMPVSEMNKHIDFGTDQVFGLKKFPVLKATASRFVVDLNRERNDIHSDQGVIIFKAWNNSIVLKKPLSKREIEERLQKYYDPFFEKLEEWLKEKIFLLDGHSMDSKGNITAKDLEKERPDICIATDSGKTASKEIIKIFTEEFEKNGFFVELGTPYSGSRAKIIHLAKKLGSEAMELEINKKIFMNEKTFKMNNQKILLLKKIVSTCLERIEKIN